MKSAAQTMNEIQTTTKLLAITAVIFVTATLISLPYQNQVANAAPATKKYQVYVTLTNVPANAEDLQMNVTISQGFGSVVPPQKTTVTSPSEGENFVGKFIFNVPTGSNANSVRVCSNTDDFSVSSCELYPLSKGGGTIRVDYPYPT